MARRFRPLLILMALMAATSPMRALGDPAPEAGKPAQAGKPADLDAAQKLTRDVCDAMAHRNFKPLLDLIRTGDIRAQLLQRMPEGYPANPEEREKIAQIFMQRIETDVPRIWAAAADAERFLPPPRVEKGALVVPVRFDCLNAQKAQFTVFQVFRYRASPEGPRLVNIETPLAGQDIVSSTVFTMPAHWPQLPEDKEKRQKQALLLAMLRGAHLEAEKAAREALKESPDDMAFRMALAGALVSMHKFDDARELYRDMLARGQAVLFARYQLAALAIAEEHYDEAVAHLQAVLDGLAEDDWILAQIANAQRLAGLAATQPAAKTAEAKATVERALKISPFSRHALEQRAKLRIHAGDLDGAAADLRMIKEHHGLNVVALLKDPDFSKLVLMEKYGDILDRPEAKSP